MHYKKVVAVFLIINVAVFFDLFQQYSPVAGYVSIGIVGLILLMAIVVFSASCCHLNPCSKCAIATFGVILALLLLTVATLAFFGIWAMSALSKTAPDSGASGFEKTLIEQRNNLVEGAFQKCCNENNPVEYINQANRANQVSITSTTSTIANDTFTSRFNPGATLQFVADTIFNGLLHLYDDGTQTAIASIVEQTANLQVCHVSHNEYCQSSLSYQSLHLLSLYAETSVENLCFWPEDLSPVPSSCKDTPVLLCGVWGRTNAQ